MLLPTTTLRLALCLPLLALLSCSGNPSSQPAAEAPGVLPGPIAGTTQTQLPNGWKLSPAGTATPLGDLPLSLEISPDGRLAAVTNGGWGENSVQLLDAATGRVLDTRVVPRRLGRPGVGSRWPHALRLGRAAQPHSLLQN